MTHRESSEREFEEIMSTSIQDVLQGNMTVDALMRFTRSQEEQTVHFCLQRMSDPGLGLDEEQLLARLLQQATVVQQFPDRAFGPGTRLAEKLRNNFKNAEEGSETTKTDELDSEELNALLSHLDQLEQAKNDSGVLPLLFALLNLNNPSIQSKVALLIEKLDTEFAYTERLLRHPNARVRANVIEALTSRADSRALEFMRLCASDRNHRVRANAGMGLYRGGDVLGLEILMTMVNHPSAEERCSATWGLGMSGKLSHLPLIIALEVSDSDDRVRHEAKSALKRIRQREDLVQARS